MERFVIGHYVRAEPLPNETDHAVQVAGGSITVRIYVPANPNRGPLPCHVYFHGGGFWLGTLEHFDTLCRSLAREAGCIVAAVGYRLAPENRFPTAVEDGYAALLWVSAMAVQLGIDPTRLSVGGVSAGGNIETVVAMMARDRKGPSLLLQVLEVPVLDLVNHNPLRVPEEGVELSSGKDLYCTHYLADASHAALSYVSPLLAEDLTGLPPALIMCAEYDPLAAEGAAYARRLAEAGVAVVHKCWPGQFHGAQPMAALIPDEAAAYQTLIASALRAAFKI